MVNFMLLSTCLINVMHAVWATFWIIVEIGALIGFVLIGIASFKVLYIFIRLLEII
jgi:hypothetical protein